VTPVAVGLIGVGFHARTVHIPALDVVSELRLRAMATSREQTARDVAERYRVQGYADYRALLDRTDVEAVIIATPPEMHEEICHAALQGGKHVFVESPGIPDVDGARAVLDIARAYKRVVQVGFLLRYSAPFELLKAHLGAQPAPRLFCYEYFPFLAHVFNLALYLSGPVERVIAATRDAAGRTATVRFHNGDTAVIIGRNLANCSVDIERVQVSTEHFFAAVEGRRRARIIADMQPVDVAEWSLASSAATTYAGQVFAERFLEHSGAAAQLRGFARAIRDGVAPRSTLEDAIETQLLAREIDEKLA
jgi:predicted dehydrogenase